MLEQSQSSIGELRNSLSSGLNLELYVGNDILQGEKVPFYIVWKDIGIRRITIRAPGFRRIVKLYNTTSFEEEDDAVVVHKDQLKLGRISRRSTCHYPRGKLSGASKPESHSRI